MDSAITFNQDEVAHYYMVRLPHLKQRHGAEWRGACPIHKGDRDSFAVESDTGRWSCFSRCGRGGDVIELEKALTGADFKTAKAEVFNIVGRRPTPNGNHSHARIAETYDYCDENGNLLYQVVRMDPKGFRQRRPDGNGGWEWSLKGVRRVLYRLPEVLKQMAEHWGRPIFLCEGERDVHTLELLGLTATTNAMGAGKWIAEYSEILRGRFVVILPDNDAVGRKHAADVAAGLLRADCDVRIVELPGLPEKGDVTDWTATGGTLRQLVELVEKQPDLTADGLAELRARWGLADEEPHQTRTEAASDWPKPEPIQSELPPVQTFSEDLLPDSFRPLVTDVTDRMQVPMDYPAVVMVLCLAGAVSRRAVIQPKANDTGWASVPNLWGGIIAPPGYMKSPVIQAVTHPLSQIQTEWRYEHEEALNDYAAKKEEFELRRAAWRDQYKLASKKGNAAPDRPEDEPGEPKLRRLIVNDSTFEALHQTMSENPAGILVIRDELTGWWSQLDKAGREGERAFCLQAWNGDTGHTMDRIGRGTIHVEACCMSMLGGIQPGRLRSYLVDALKDGPGNDGLLQRFQLLVWPDTARDWSYVDRAPAAASEEEATKVFRKLVDMDAENPARFRFGSDAQELFIEWLAELEAKIRGDELHPALISHLSKYRGLMPNLALLFELAERSVFDVFDGSTLAHSENFVSLENTQRAAEWCDYLESHARRVYSCIVTPQLRAARELADKIKRRKVGADGFFSCRDVYTKGWSGLDLPEAAKQAAEVLQDAGWLRVSDGESSDLLGRGRPAIRYEINPGVWQ